MQVEITRADTILTQYACHPYTPMATGQNLTPYKHRR
jgi:hypothetical protein